MHTVYSFCFGMYDAENWRVGGLAIADFWRRSSIRSMAHSTTWFRTAVVGTAYTADPRFAPEIAVAWRQKLAHTCAHPVMVRYKVEQDVSFVHILLRVSDSFMRFRVE